MMMKLANYEQFDYISAFGFFYWFNLVDYASLTAPCPPVYPASNANQNAACDAAIQALQNRGARQALDNKLISVTGQAYQGDLQAIR